MDTTGGDRLGWTLHLATLLAAAVFLVVWYRHQWFFGDEWDPIMLRSLGGGAAKGLLDPHNEHWSTLAILVYRAHLTLFGLSTYLPVALLAVAVQLATGHLLWRLSRRVGASALAATLVVALLLFFGPADADLVFA